jgi:hypothetical protein
MRRLAMLGAVIAAAGAFGGWALATTAFFSPPAAIVQFGYVKSITLTSKGYELKLDPAYFLGGLTAQRAAAQDGREVDNDYYIVNPDHRLLTYRVPASAPATVLTNPGPSGIKSTKVPIAELAQIVKGKNPAGRPLLEKGSARNLGYWVKTSIDTVKSIDQQYQP